MEEVKEAEDDYHQLWQFHYVVLFAAHRLSCLRMLVEDTVAAEDEKAGKSSEKYCRYPTKDWYYNGGGEPNPKVVADTSILLDVVSREGNKLNKVLRELGIYRDKRLNSVVEKVQQAHQKQAMAASGSSYANVMEIHACVFFVAWKSAAEVLKLAAVNRGELVRQHDAEKAALRE
ncbi:hypothetical protein GIB67_000131 [Kingdonia uniflora]|uniref:Uncharacterized protein n=1 Tax=Kingdonia uniflora TaxID=39325 RepID=A0A7J7LTF0_9MAGN|nr:hypothetical protein GIB67_000131 [Kingdonia uniflora]